MSKELIVSTLTVYQQYTHDKYVIKMNDKVVFIGDVNVFHSEGIAKRAILHRVFGNRIPKHQYEKNKADLESLISEGIISIEKVS